VVCRWGGDEFVILLKNTTLAGAEARALAIQKDAFGEFLLKIGDRESRISIAASVGVAEYRSGEDAFEFFDRADQLMYEKKTQQKANAARRALIAEPGRLSVQ
jgi:diguanylate cyclase (GGDEF)-like protein